MKLNNNFFFLLYVSKLTEVKPFRITGVNPKKQDTYQEGLLVAHWAQTERQKPAGISTQDPLTQMPLEVKSALSRLPLTLCSRPLSQPL